MLSKHPLRVFLIAVGVLIGLANFYAPYRHFPKSSQAARIPVLQRGWPEYTAIATDDSAYHVVLLGNSQALGYELNAPSENFSSQLKRSLGRQGLPVVFHNWSVGGMRTVDLEILLARAVERRVDKVVFMLHMDSFEDESMVRLGYSPCDLELLLAEPMVYSISKELRIGNRLDVEDRIRLVIQRYSGIYRWRVKLWDESTPYLSSAHEQFLKGKQDALAQVLDLNDHIDLKDSLSIGWFSGELLHQEVPEIKAVDARVRLHAFNEWAELAIPLLKSHGIAFEFIWAPYYQPMYDPSTLSIIHEQFINPIQEQYPDRVTDFSAVLPDSVFISRAHLNAAGHQTLADLLQKHWSDGI